MWMSVRPVVSFNRFLSSTSGLATIFSGLMLLPPNINWKTFSSSVARRPNLLRFVTRILPRQPSKGAHRTEFISPQLCQYCRSGQ